MKTFMKFLFAAFVAFTTLSASATCYRTSNLPPGSPPAVLTNGLWCTEGEGRNNNQFQGDNSQWLANQAIRIPTNGVIPSGYCTWDERLKNVGISTILGGIFGVLVGDNGRAVGQGAAVGLVAGTVVPCAAQQQYIQQQGGRIVQRQQNGELYQGGNTVAEPSSCNIEGMNPIRDVSAEDCKKLNGRMTVKVPSSCDIDGMGPIHGVSSEECAKLAGRMAVRVPAKTTQVEVTPAYCRLTLTRNGVSTTKNVLNPERQQSYCDELPRALQNGTKTWENLQVVNL